ncbi:MAG: ATP synthase F1 subunit delta [Planctomycetes bacterium]|nr:ATP synthase F1 subunit delta [Planctomycetota bacterium]
MIEKTLSKRYAAALLTVTNKEGTVEQTESTLLALAQVYRENARFRGALSSPKIPRSSKRQFLHQALAGASQAVRDFFDILVRKNRTKLIPHIAEMYDRLADAFKGIVRVHVKSAYPLTQEQLGRIKTHLDRITGKTCALEPATDPSLKGGMLIRMGDTVVDGTVAYRLKTLREKLQELQKR